MSLNNTFRFGNIKEMFGKNVDVDALIKKIRDDDPPHTILITGEYGTGKTSLARFIASSLDCYEEDSQNIDYTEVNCADLRGIDNARDIIRDSQFKPQKAKYRVWIIDEAHQMTKDYQDAMLKITEKPPKHCVFIFCTNNPSKFNAGFRRRCYEVKMNILDDSVMCEYISSIAKQIELDLKKTTIAKIADKTKGSPGVALKILEGIVSLKPDAIEAYIDKMDETELGTRNLCQILLRRDMKEWKNIIECLVSLESAETDAEMVRRAVLGYCKACFKDSKIAPKVYIIASAFERNVWDSGYPGLYIRCFEAMSQ